MYGKRDAAIHGLAIIHWDKLNLFKSSAGWKHGVIRDVSMLPRAEMFKPDVSCQKRNFLSTCLSKKHGAIKCVMKGFEDSGFGVKSKNGYT